MPREDARNALRRIRLAFARDRVVVTRHFAEAMRDDVLFWGDIVSAIESSEDAEFQGLDAAGDPKYRVEGDATDDRRIAIICVLKNGVVLVTTFDLK